MSAAVQYPHRSRGTGAALLGLLGMVIAGTLAMFGGQQVGMALSESGAAGDAVPEFMEPGSLVVPGDIEFSQHTVTHSNQAWDAQRVYTALKAGQCAATARLCDTADKDVELWLCLDPRTHLVAGMVVAKSVFAITGYAARLSYWQRQIKIGRWEVCP